MKAFEDRCKVVQLELDSEDNLVDLLDLAHNRERLRVDDVRVLPHYDVRHQPVLQTPHDRPQDRRHEHGCGWQIPPRTAETKRLVQSCVRPDRLLSSKVGQRDQGGDQEGQRRVAPERTVQRDVRPDQKRRDRKRRVLPLRRGPRALRSIRVWLQGQGADCAWAAVGRTDPRTRSCFK